MNLSFWKDHIDELVIYMEKENYSPITIKNHTRMADSISAKAPLYDWKDYQDVLNWYQDNYPASSIRGFFTTITNLNFYQKYGYLPRYSPTKKLFMLQYPSKGNLDLSFWYINLEQMLNEMREAGYADISIKNVYNRAIHIIVTAQTVSWDSYQDILDWYGQQKRSSETIKCVSYTIKHMEDYQFHDVHPNNWVTINNRARKNEYYPKLIPCFKNLIDCVLERHRCMLKESSFKTYKSKVASFLYYHQILGYKNLADINEHSINSYFLNGDSCKSHSISASIRHFFQMAQSVYPEDCQRILLFIPKIKRHRNNIQYLTSEEGEAFRKELYGSNISCKSKAIGQILFQTGMRSSDIANIKWAAIDLKKCTFSVEQPKTGHCLELPLSISVGNAIYEYCIKERPIIDSEYLFITSNAPLRKMTPTAIEINVNRTMQEAGIRTEKGDRKGTHIFRHRIVSELLQHDVSTPVISSILGHESPTSLKSYLYADIEHLRECSLPIAEFPLLEEVFNVE